MFYNKKQTNKKFVRQYLIRLWVPYTNKFRGYIEVVIFLIFCVCGGGGLNNIAVVCNYSAPVLDFERMAGEFHSLYMYILEVN